MNVGIGPSLQTARWSNGRGDLSIGMIARGEFLYPKQADFSLPVFGTLGIPVGNEIFFRGYLIAKWIEGGVRRPQIDTRMSLEVDTFFQRGIRMTLTPFLEYGEQTTTQALMIGAGVRLQ